MSWTYKQLAKALSNKRNSKHLYDTKHGLERECLRVKEDGALSVDPHPKSLGQAFTNPFISTDFSESQLEFITPTSTKESLARQCLEDIHSYSYTKIKGELLWPSSMPARLPHEKQVPLAEYGTSSFAKKKTIYRRGLGYRYSRKMQTISGIHYNFSFTDKFWDFLYKKCANKGQERKDFISESYMHIARNFIELTWLDTYLFGASPAMDQSYMKKKKRPLKKWKKDTFYAKYGTAIRMSRFGYCCKVQSVLNVSFNSLKDYIHDLRNAISTPHDKYKKIGLKDKEGKQLQLNTNILQIPNEYYAPIRAKRVTRLGENMLDLLEKDGIEYLEVRSLDISPFDPTGVPSKHLVFMHTLMVYCLMKESGKMSPQKMKESIKNNEKTALFGRKKSLKLIRDGKKIRLRDWGIEVLEEMMEVAEILDKNFKDNRHKESIEEQIAKIIDPSLTPSARVLAELKKKKISFLEFSLEQAEKHRKYLRKQKISKVRQEQLDKAVTESFTKQEEIEAHDEMYVKGFEEMEISTQILIRDAQNRGIKVEALDQKNSFIKLTKDDKVEYVHQATKTSKDSIVSYDMMDNKIVTKEMLQPYGISFPQGQYFYDKKKALSAYQDFSKGKWVVKPATTNYGIGISFIEKGDDKSYVKAINEAFKHSKSVIVEEFISGDEYRFLVIDGKVHAVNQRIPANVVGDGKHKIRELAKMKNEKPKNYKLKQYYIKIGKVEKAKLKAQKLTPNSIPKKGQRIFLRENTNVSTGGDSIDMMDQIPKIFQKIAIKAAEAVDSKICGVDMMIKEPKAGAKAGNYTIIELNYNPSLYIQKFPIEGKSRDVGNPVLDLLGF